jgi:hypothetical protein
MFSGLRANFSRRLKRAKFGAFIGAANGVYWGTGLTSLIAGQYVANHESPSPIPFPECGVCSQCDVRPNTLYWTDEKKTNCYAYPDPSKFLVKCQTPEQEQAAIARFTILNAQNCADHDVGAWFGTYWPHIVFIPIAIGTVGGFIYGLLSASNDLPDELKEPLIDASINDAKHSELANSAPDAFLDPATYLVMTTPVVTPCGHSMDVSTATRCDGKCLICRSHYQNEDLWPNKALVGLIKDFTEKKPGESLLTKDCLDPKTLKVMDNPAIIPCGHSLDETSIGDCKGTCPVESCEKEFKEHRINYCLKKYIAENAKSAETVITISDHPSTLFANSSHEVRDPELENEDEIEMSELPTQIAQHN